MNEASRKDCLGLRRIQSLNIWELESAEQFGLTLEV